MASRGRVCEACAVTERELLEERKQQFDQELAEVKARRDDSTAQIKLLHQQLDSVASQIASLQQTRASLGEADPGLPALADTTLESLRELNGYLRREKEISEVQLELKTQESNRLQAELASAKTLLDEARLKLEQERRLQADNNRSSISHQELMERLNELNLIRESNVTLRAENQQAKALVRVKAAKVDELQAKISPLEGRVAELESQKVFMDEEMKQLAEDRDRWQKRTEGILTKYGRVDPAELDQLKQTISSLEAERESLKQAAVPLTQKIEELEATIESERTQWRESRTKLIDQAKEKARQQTASIRELTAQKNELQEQANSSAGQLVSAKSDLEARTGELSALEEQVQALQRQVQSTAAEGQTDAVQQDTNSAHATELQRELDDLRRELESVRARKLASSKSWSSRVFSSHRPWPRETKHLL